MTRWTCRLIASIIVLIYSGPLFAQHTITKWPHNKKGAVSITFDDGHPSQYSLGVPALDFYGMKGTFFLISDLTTAFGNWSDWRMAAATGHEIGSHTKSHPFLASLTAAQIQTELTESKNIIDQQIPSQKCLTLAYPYGNYNETVEAAASNYYISARGITNEVNYPPIDFFAVKANGDDSNSDIAAIETFTDLAEANGGWQVFYIHTLDGAGSGWGNFDLSMFDRYLNYLATKNMWVDTYGAVVKFIKERDSAIVSVVSASSAQIVLNLTDAMSDAIYDQPLTVRSEAPAGWLRVNVQQGGSNTLASTVFENGTPVVYFNAIPDRGSITLTPASLHVSALNPPSIVVGSGGFVLEATGSDFVSGSIVRWNGSARTTTFVSSTKLQAYISAADVAAQGTASVSALNPDGTASNALSFLVNPITAAPTASLLSNPGFESGVSPWLFYTNTVGSFDNNVAGNGSAHAGRAIITQDGANIQLYQSGIALEANAQYRLTFKAYSNTGHDLSVSIQKHGSPYTNYGLNQFCNIDTSWTNCSMSFAASGFTGTVSDGRLMVWLASYATAGDQYFFDDVMLEKNGALLSPAVINQPWNRTVIAGQTATFAVAAGGQEPFHYQWQRNGINISGATAASYTTAATASTDSGSAFRCVIVNAGGSVTSSAATLIVLSSFPAIATQPSNQSVIAGQTATFSVAAGGQAPLYYQWQRNGIDISGATAASYTTPATALTDSGSTFRCTISNAAGSVTSDTATLTVTLNLPVITAQPESQTATVGQTATFTIAATGNGIITYQWRRNGAVIPGATGDSYTTPETTLADSGAIFTCVVSSDTGSVTSAAATLTVVAIMPPTITAQPENASVAAGQTATFTVAATGSAPLSYQWHRNGTNISGATGASYTTPPTTLADSGSVFACTVNNTAGSISSSAATLIVATTTASLLSNPGFEPGVSPWLFYSNTSGAFDNAAAGSGSPFAGHVTIGQAGSNVQLYQSGIVLEANTQYRLTFMAYSNTGHDVSVSLNKHGSPYTNYGLSNSLCDLTNSWAGCSMQFNTSGFSGTVNDGRLMFWLAPYATAGDQYFFDDVVLEKVVLVDTPVITTQPANQSVIVGQTATFSVTATSGLPLSYQWKRGGTDIAGAISASYTTPPTTLADSGSVFTCTVSNAAGSISSSAATLTVTTTTTSLLSNPGFEFGAAPWVFYTNTSGSFNNSAAGNGSAHAGHAVITTAGSNIQLFQILSGLEANTLYRLSFAAYSNTGHDLAVSLIKSVSPYTGYGLSSSYFNLTSSWSTHSVEFTTSGFAGTVNDARLMFWLASYAATGDQYYFDDVTLEKVVASSPPAITIQPANQMVVVGQSATFSIEATGSGTLSYQWQRNGTNISGATGASYTTPATVLADSGATFTCVVSNSAGNATSNAAVLTVAAVSLSLLSDDFNPSTAEPNPSWRFYDPYNTTAGNDRGESALSFDGANASIAVPSGDTHDLWIGRSKAPRLLQSAENKDFAVEVKFESPVSMQYQMQGIVVQQTNDIFSRFDVIHNGSSPSVFAAYMTADGYTTFVSQDLPSAPLYLQVLRSGSQWTFRYSYDGAAWTTAGTFVQPITVMEVGFFAGNHDPNPAFTSVVDYFMNLAAPIVDLD